MAKFSGKPSARILSLFVACAALGACATGGLDQVRQNQCPMVDVLATADKIKLGDTVATLGDVRLKCLLDSKSENRLLAEVTVTGRAASGTKLPIFVAALDRQDAVLARAQYRLTAREATFQLTLPPMEYGKKGDGLRPRLVVGFVLNAAQLEENRADYKKALGL